MAFEPGGMADKLGNRYEGRWIANQFLKLLSEDLLSVTVELVGPDEQGVDISIVEKDESRQYHQCKARFAGSENLSVSDLKNRGILQNAKNHLTRDPNLEFALISAIPARNLSDLCESARQSTGNERDFYQYQIQKIGNERRKLFGDFCSALELNPGNERDLKAAFDYLKRIFFFLIPDDQNSWKEMLVSANFLLTGNPETAISALLTFVENEDWYRKPIYAQDLMHYLEKTHKIYPRLLQHDSRIGITIERLQEEFSDSIQPGLIQNKLIPRVETAQIVDLIEQEHDVVVHGAAGYGKSGVLYELTEYLVNQGIPYLSIRLDRRIPSGNARLFGESMGLPESPAHCLVGWAAGRKCVLVLDQLDAIRWTSDRSANALDVCKEIIRQVRSLRRDGKKIVIVFACRTFDIENDPEIRNLLNESEKQSFAKVQVKEFSNEHLMKVIGSGIASLTNSQKKILSIPQHLAVWMQLQQDTVKPEFRSATDLMRRFWENRRQVVAKESRASVELVNDFLNSLLNYIEKKGEISVPSILAQTNPGIRDVLISSGVLQQELNRICFCHQAYLDYLIAERLLILILENESSITDWLGERGKQTLFRREQLRQLLSMLIDEAPGEFISSARMLLESDCVRFYLKHLVLEIVGQMDEVPEGLGGYCVTLTNDKYWHEHILETVYLSHHVWVSYLIKEGVVSNWLRSSDEHLVSVALWLLRSVADFIPDEVTEILRPLVMLGGVWPEHALNAICWNASDDSEMMFDLRMQLIECGQVRDYIDWRNLCSKYPMRAIRLIEAVISNSSIENDNFPQKRRRLDNWYPHDMEALLGVAKDNSIATWDLLMPCVVQLSSTETPYLPRVKRWHTSRDYSEETDIHDGVIELLIAAGQDLAAQQPEAFIMRVLSLGIEIPPEVEEIIITSYTYLPPHMADHGIQWLLDDPNRFQLGSGTHEPKWAPATRLIAALSAYCSEKWFQELEESIIHYRDHEEKLIAEICLKARRRGCFDAFWGQAQYFLLPALDVNRTKTSTIELIRVLERRFSHYTKEYFLDSYMVMGGTVGSKLDPNLEKISDRAWRGIINNEAINEEDHRPWIQAGPNQILESSIFQFAGSLGRIARRFPERFGKLALRFSDNIHPSYVSAIIEAISSKQPGNDVPEIEKSTWESAQVQTLEAVLTKYQTGDDRQVAMAFCRLIEKRAEENWSDKIIARLNMYACNHPEPGERELIIGSDKNIDDVAVETLFQNTINCVRGVAARTIGKLLWEHPDWLRIFSPSIKALVIDPNPVARMAALNAIYPILNIDKDLAVELFCKACKDDLRVAASPYALHFFKYIIPSHINQAGPLIQSMVTSQCDEIRLQGAIQATARWLINDYFEDEFHLCCQGTPAQRKGVAHVSASLIKDNKYAKKCQDILHQFLNDPDKDVRMELRRIGDSLEVPSDLTNLEFLKAYIKSQAFADDPGHVIRSIQNFSGNLLPFAETIFSVCEEFSTTLREKSRDFGSSYPYMVGEISSVLLRLYERAEGEHDYALASRCLDIWDLLFEKRVGRVIELTKAIAQ